ncbi:hypothetical protein [Novosphingobium sp.]|uniref:hypothetical protein n=1 Tax=Novosphingobium sp. TaxID=1874826 RepID=UPI001DF3668C|nr:hypothetical protein [Novosphingobium sp.]MBX9664526.1 hypothetical protein [Novosphingobium sp.]
MNRPLLAGIIVLAVVLALAWFIWVGTRQPRALAVLGGFVFWAIPLFYAGGWSAGATVGETTLVLLVIIVLLIVRDLRYAALSWASRPTLQSKPNVDHAGGARDGSSNGEQESSE